MTQQRPYFTDDTVTLHHGDSLEVLRTLPNRSVSSCVTSPPYFGLRDYGAEGQYGLEASPAEYVATMQQVFREVHRVLVDDGTLWLNIGDTYSAKQRGNDEGWDKSRLSNPARMQKAQAASLRESRHTTFDRAAKNLLGIPWRVAFALQDDGWILRNDIAWSKPNAMPESVTDRLASRHEHVFLFAKQRHYWFDLAAIREPHAPASVVRAQPRRAGPGRAAREGGGYGNIAPAQTLRVDQIMHAGGRNPGDVWEIPTKPFPAAHFAAMPPALAERCVLAGCRPGGVVLDPFSGSGTTGLVAGRHGRRYLGIDISAEYLDLSLRTRLAQGALLDSEETA